MAPTTLTPGVGLRWIVGGGALISRRGWVSQWNGPARRKRRFFKKKISKEKEGEGVCPLMFLLLVLFFYIIYFPLLYLDFFPFYYFYLFIFYIFPLFMYFCYILYLFYNYFLNPIFRLIKNFR